jgi:D-arginine dehydrogenase
MSNFDAIVIGGGIAGASIGYELSSDRSVCLLEMESALAFHTTGRSAATFLEALGTDQIRGLTTGSRAFLENPPEMIESAPLSPLPLLMYAKQGRTVAIKEFYEAVNRWVPNSQILDASEVISYCPVMRQEHVESGFYDPNAMELDVQAIHQGYVRGFRANGGEIKRSEKVVAMSHADGLWQVETSAGNIYHAPIVVNAAGAWGDEVAKLAGVNLCGLVPKVRTIFMVNSPSGDATKDLPIVGDIDGAYYFKPEGNQFLVSPMDQTPSAPCDASPDELEIARALDELNAATTIAAKSVNSTWGGLRSFVADENPVIGYDQGIDGFFWMVGQGGYGIQTSPAVARLSAALVRRQGVPEDLISRGVDASALAPGRASLKTAS